jgi:two-component system, LytTR family, sensor kinase
MIAKQTLRRLLEYTAFWTFSVWFLAQYFADSTAINTIDWIYTLMFHLSLGFGVAVNSFLLIPRLLSERRFLVYGASVLVLLEVCIRMNQFTFNTLSDLLFPGYYFISYYDRWDLLQFMVAYIGITSLIQFSRTWFTETETRRRLAEIQREKTVTELKVLRSQVQPHFLFNSLNTIYALTRKKSSGAPDAVLKLSDLLRYTIRQGDRDEVPLDEEAAYLKSYIDLQRMRMNDPERVVFSYIRGENDANGNETEPAGTLIAPLLLIVFVENAYTHADLVTGGNIRIELKSGSDGIRFLCSNPVSPEPGNKSASNGTGIANARRRLELHYPGRHTLDIDEKDGHFVVNLHIEKDHP